MVNENEYVMRIIKMEQRASVLSDRSLRYNETRAYKKMSKMKRQEFEEYMNKKGRTRHVLLILAILFYAAFGIFYFRATGNVVKSIIGVGTFSALGNVFNLLFVLVTSFIIVIFLVNFIREMRFRRNFNIKKYV